MDPSRPSPSPMDARQSRGPNPSRDPSRSRQAVKHGTVRRAEDPLERPAVLRLLQ